LFFEPQGETVKHVFVRPSEPKDASAFVQWSLNNPFFDPAVMMYRKSTCHAAFNRDGVLAYMPIQRPLMIDSVAIRPGCSETEQAIALKELTQAAVTQAYIEGAGEIYFLGTNETTNEFAKKHAYEELPYRVYRIKLKDLENKPDENPNL
jgi:hypothetical protein